MDAPQRLVVLSNGARLTVSAPGGVLIGLSNALATTAEVQEAEEVDGPEDWPDARFVLLVSSQYGGGLLRRDDEIVATGDDLDLLCRTLLSELHLAIAVHARDALFVHAGVVAWNGVAIVIPGRSMSGKSSLVRALVAAGATYFSDEYAVLDENGLVHPYPKPLSIRRPDGSVESIDPETIGRVGFEPVPVGLIVSTHFEPEAPWAPQVLDGSRAVLPLVDNTVVARLHPTRMLDVTTRVIASGARCLVGARPEAADISEDLFERLEGAAQAEPTREQGA